MIDALGRPMAGSDELAALDEERAFADRSSFRTFELGGADARTWLNDLLTAGVARLEEGRACRSLLLGPTGRIRADVHVLPWGEDGLLLVQDPAQPSSIADLLRPYVLSSAVTIADRSADVALYCVPGRAADRVGWAGTRPSILGSGIDLVTSPAGSARLESMMLNKQLTEVGEDALEVWRIRRGVARFPVDITEASVPAEADLDDLIDVGKGCFLGQESVAKIRNLGHPTHVVRAASSDADLGPGAEVLAGGEVVGQVTSAAAAAGSGTACLVRVRWGAAQAPLATPDGAPLRPSDRSP
jgi:folate-binding protein YgfZ